MKSAFIGSMGLALGILVVFFVNLEVTDGNLETAGFAGMAIAAIVFMLARASSYVVFVGLMGSVSGYIATQTGLITSGACFLLLAFVVGYFFKQLIHDPEQGGYRRFLAIYMAEFSLIALPIMAVCYL